jgi:hypothetical protein
VIECNANVAMDGTEIPQENQEQQAMVNNFNISSICIQHA